MHQENSVLPESAPRRDIDLESFAHKSSGGYVRRLTLPDGRWWFPAGDVCKGLGVADVRHALAAYVADSMHTTLGSVCALHRMPIPNQPTWDGTLPLLTRRGVESLLASPAGAGAERFTAWVQGTIIGQPTGGVVARVEQEPVQPDAIEISDFVYGATGARIRRLTMPDGTHWFPAADVCRHLGYANTTQTVSQHVPVVDVKDLDSLCGAYTVGIPAGREWRRHSLMVSLPGLVCLVNSSSKPEAAPFKRWVAGVVATIQREGRFELPGVQTIFVDPPAEPVAPGERFPVAEFLSLFRESEERQGRAQERLLARADESHRAMMDSHQKITEVLTGLLAKPEIPVQAAPKAEPLPPPAPRPVPMPPPPVAAGPRSAPEILAAWQRRFEAPEDVWSVAAYIVPEMLLHGELVAVGERMGARLGLTANQVHRCLGYLRRHGCIRQVGLTPGVGCPVYVFA
jgi:prophage antirepressor-like protein